MSDGQRTTEPWQNAGTDRRCPPHDPRDVHTEADASTTPRERLLVFWDGGFATHALPASGKVTIGRLQECEIWVDHPSVSRKHAELLLGPQLRVVDLGSFNGTRVGGVRIAPNEPTVVPPRSVVEIGSTFMVVEGPSGGGAREDAAPGTLRPPAMGQQDAELVVADERMAQLHRLLRAVAQGTISVVLLGETGVGKEVIAQSIHRYSPRASRPFVSINCAAIPEALLESELFGHERGAFTGAVREKAGLSRRPTGGRSSSTRWARCRCPRRRSSCGPSRHRQIVRVGGVRPRPVDVRFVSATNRDLEQLIAARAFRRDLFFRLNGISVHVPPLRERLGELEGLARRFLAEFAVSLGRRPLPLSSEALVAAARPRLARQRARAAQRGRARRAPLPGRRDPRRAPLARGARRERCSVPRARRAPPSGDAPPESVRGGLSEELQATERRRILEALEQCAGNQTRAAEMLGISRRSLIHRLETYGVPRPRKRG